MFERGNLSNLKKKSKKKKVYFNESSNSSLVTALQLAIWLPVTAQKMKFSIKDFFSKCDKISHLSFYEN